MAAVVTGLGVVSPFGRGRDALWSAMAAGRDGLVAIERFDTALLDRPLCGMVPELNTAAAGARPPEALLVELAIAAGREAIDGAALADVPPARRALVVGTSPVEADVRLHRLTDAIADALDLHGPRLTVSTACTSSTTALALALELLDQGDADVVVAGGADVLTPLVVAGFRALGVLAPGRCAPFSAPIGVSLGEGAGFLVLERADHAARRGRTARHALLGQGLSCDGYHDTGPDPTGAGVARALRAALRHAGCTPDQVDYVNAHGTGTAANDPAEWRALQSVLGARAAAIPVSSSKSFLGHAQAAAGVLELAATLVSLERGAIPPTQRFGAPRPHSPPDCVGQATPRPAACDVALTTNSAFGGANCALVIGPAARAAGAPAAATRPVFVAGLAAVGPHGRTLDALADALARGTPLAGRADAGPLRDAVPTADPRGLDPITRYLVTAAGLALTDAGVRVRGALRERAGIVAGIDRVSPASDAGIEASIDARGLRNMSAALFARMVLNAPVGTAARLLELRGPTCTLSAGGAAGLLAIVQAARLLSVQGELDLVVAGGAEELTADAAPSDAEGAAFAVLSATPRPGARAVRLAGWALAGSGAADDARRDALARAGLAAGDLDLAIDPRPLGRAAGAAGSAIGFVAAALLLARGKARAALLEAGGEGAASVAAVLVVDGGGSHDA